MGCAGKWGDAVRLTEGVALTTKPLSHGLKKLSIDISGKMVSVRTGR